jgi:hypothetical protein
MAKDKKLSRDYTPEEVAEEMKGIDEGLPEADTVQRRPLFSARSAGGAEHRAGVEEEAEEPRREERPKPTPPPRGVKPKEGK